MIKDFEMKEGTHEPPAAILNNECIEEMCIKPLCQMYLRSINPDVPEFERERQKVGNTWELTNVHLVLDPYKPYLSIFGRPFKHDYLDREHKWYMSQDLSIKGWMDDIKIWNFCASKDDKQEINSNYGWCIFSEENGSQYENCLQKLKADKNTREALMIYTRPSIHKDAVENGKHDFICTISAHVMIRDNCLFYTATQRSCDIVSGLSFDFPWHCFVYQMLYEELKNTYPDLQVGYIYYDIHSLHVYERSEQLILKYIKNKMESYVVPSVYAPFSIGEWFWKRYNEVVGTKEEK